MVQPIAVIFAFVLAGTIALSITLPLTVNSDPPLAPSGFGSGSLGGDYKFIEKVIDSQKDWTSVLATNERDLSNQFFAQSGNEPKDRILNALAIVWGQLIDHDIVLTTTDPETLRTIAGQFNVTRTVKNPLTGESKTLITPPIDGTVVYGDYFNEDKLQLLKEPSSCLLKTSTDVNGNQLLPLTEQGTGFIAGDIRSDEHSVLTALHTLLVREHNRLCGELPEQWTPDQRFWKARQIVIAKINHITFNEWAPLLFGTQSHLLYARVEDSNARINDVFAGAAFRFGHSMIPDPIGEFTLLELFFNITLIQQQGIEPFLRAAASTPAERCDTSVVDGLRNILFGREDLVTRNLFRARDMGLPTYQEICAFYGTTPTSNFEDPLLGLLNEPLVEGSSLPHTLAIIVAEQLLRLRISPSSLDLGSAYELDVGTETIGRLIQRNTDITEKLKFTR